MNIKHVLQQNLKPLVLILFTTLIVSAAGCAAPTAAVPTAPTSTVSVPTSTDTAIPTTELREVVLTFDGETCHYEGPAVITEGDVTITLNNKSVYKASLWIRRLDDGKTWQDMLEYIGLPGSNVHPPSWSSGSFFIAPMPDNPDAWVYTFKEGLYALCCCTCFEPSGPRGVWPGTSLEVIAK
jgi:hypothetical protein